MIFEYDETTKLSYETAGHGGEQLILFHGFGLTREVFKSWVPILEGKYTLHLVDLFYHGESEKELGNLQKSEWTEIFSAFLRHLAIDRFSVFGFSLGARFAICSAIELASQCDHLILSAPDAIYKTPWFKAATSPGLKWVFKYFMLNPKAMHRLVKMCVKLRLVSVYMGDFVEKELGKPENRRRVYISWNHFKPLGYSHRKLQKHFTNSTFAKTILLGKKDIVIAPNKILPILKGCGFDVIELDRKHHQMVREEVAQEMLKYS